MIGNPFLDQFLMFYSQARVGNGQTRGLETEISRKTYVETRLDRELATGILRGQFRLVILTGNAGDGKTAFIQKVEEEAIRRGATLTRTGFGNQFDLDGISFKTLHDGSVEMSDSSNLQMLDLRISEARARDHTLANITQRPTAGLADAPGFHCNRCS